jgi:hypothetical protein
MRTVNMRPLFQRALVVMIGVVVAALAGCGSSSSAARPSALQVLDASVAMNPLNYKGACGATQDITFTAKLSANPNNLGGSVHYTWRIGYAAADGVVAFEKGQTSKTISRVVSFAISPDADRYLGVAFATSQPNAVAAPEARFEISCSVPLSITDVSVSVQPWTSGCGPHAFGFAAVLTAPANNAGGEVRYSWWFHTGGSVSGTVVFAPGQTTQTVTTAQTYNIQRRASASSSAAPADLLAARAASNLAPPSPTPGPKPSPTPGPRPTPKPTPAPWPVVGPGGVYGVLYVTAPNAISNDAWATIYC